jgi:membrane-associated phospholipid phosphatase
MPMMSVLLMVMILIGCGAGLGQLIAARETSQLAIIASRLRNWGRDSPSAAGRFIRSRLGEHLVDLPILLAFAAILSGSLWAFFELLEDVIMGDGVTGFDRRVYRWLQQHRQPGWDRLLVAVTELGDAQVALPVAVVAIVLLAGLKLWREAMFLALAIVGAAGFVAGLKRVIHRARPVDIYDGLAEYSFPSGHAGMSIVLFGFLAFLLASRAGPGWRRIIYSTSIVLVLLIGFSRIYLGAHWLSDVLAGFAFGLAWNSALAIAYLRKLSVDAPRSPTRTLVRYLAATLLIAGGWHMLRDYSAELQRYSQNRVLAPLARPTVVQR